MERQIDISEARRRFRDALMHTHATRNDAGEVEAAAAGFCRVLRIAGEPPERALVSAKAVIEETIDGDDALLAERAISRCIEFYFRE